MLSPIEYLEAYVKEQREEYKRVLNLKYNTSVKIYMSQINAFEAGKKADLKGINDNIKIYKESINTLENIKNLNY